MNKNVRLVGIFDKNKPEIFDGEVMEDGDLLYKESGAYDFVCLDSEELANILDSNHEETLWTISRAIEDKLKELNT